MTTVFGNGLALLSLSFSVFLDRNISSFYIATSSNFYWLWFMERRKDIFAEWAENQREKEQIEVHDHCSASTNLF